MAREVSRDYQEFIEFMNNYQLNHKFSNKGSEQIKIMHKLYYSYLVLITECEENDFFEENIHFRYKESCSDLGHALLLAYQGLYKPSYLILRSSIENFIRGLGFQVDPSALTITKVYELFDIAKKYNSSKMNNIENIIHSLHTEYGALCKYTHTSSTHEMTHLTAFYSLPSIDISSLKIIVGFISRIVRSYLMILISSKHDDFFKKISNNNRMVIFNALGKRDKYIINTVSYNEVF